MLAGHNRLNAAKIAGLTEVPAIVKENLSDENAYVYVIETNLMQRGEEYGLSGRSVARLLRVNELVPELKDKLDAGKISLVTAVQLSYVPVDIQRAVSELEKPISTDVAVKFRDSEITVDDVRGIVCSSAKKQKASEKAVKFRLKYMRNISMVLKQMRLQRL